VSFLREWAVGSNSQEKIRPGRKLQFLAFPDDLKNPVVSGLKALSQLPLRFFPVFSKSRFADPL